MRLLAIAFTFAVFASAVGRSARADGPPHRSTFALVVTNNHSIELGRPDLHYADDDGVKYAEVFRMIAPESNVHLLTELDRDTEALYPELRGKTQAPTRAAVAANAAQIARAAAEARARGDEVDFYFVFAGHGDVEGGKGFLELRDARFTSDDVAALLKAIPASRSHVILDSCNSFFVLNARKPGGRRGAIPEEAAESLRARLPETGVFLSTSAEAEVFEWSELQSGIFSHAVRSGLLGAADANLDGVVTYDELAAFVGVASSRVKNPLYRPKVFARGPHGRGDEPLFLLSSARGARLELEAGPHTRLTVRDGEDVPWIDVNKEAGTAVVLRLPERLAAHVSLEEREVTDQGSRLLRRSAFVGVAGAEPLRLADATPSPSSTSRGPDEALRMLFGAPFGPRALAAFQATEARDEPPVYGVSREDVERMRLMLAQVAEVEQSQRYQMGAWLLGVSAVQLGSGIGTRVGAGSDRGQLGTAYAAMGVGIVGIGAATYELSTRSAGEGIYADFVRGMAAAGPGEAARIFARTDERLHVLARRYRLQREIGVGLGILLTTATGAATVVLAVDRSAVPGNEASSAQITLLGTSATALGIFTVYNLFPRPIERMVGLWDTDPSLTRIPRLTLTGLSVVPMPHAMSVGARGVF